MTHKNRKKSRIFMFLSTGCYLLRAEGFSCSLGVLYGGQGISKLQFLIQKIEIKFPAKFFFQFQVIKPWIRIRDPDPESGSGIRIRNQKKCWIRIRIRIRIKSIGSETLLFTSVPDSYPDPLEVQIRGSGSVPKRHGSTTLQGIQFHNTSNWPRLSTQLPVFISKPRD